MKCETPVGMWAMFRSPVRHPTKTTGLLLIVLIGENHFFIYILQFEYCSKHLSYLLGCDRENEIID